MPGRPLSALLSQVLVAFTVELDNEFERRMHDAGYPGARLSWIAWANLLRFVAAGPLSMGDLARQAHALPAEMKFELGCLERWRFVILEHPSHSAATQTRPGWGSGRGIRADHTVRLSSKGVPACRLWPPLAAEIEQCWDQRFGSDVILRLRDNLAAIANQLDCELPLGLPLIREAALKFPPRSKSPRETLPLPTLLSHLLLTFRLEFDREAPVALVHCANTLRVLEEGPVRAAEIPRLTGSSPETSDIGWQLKPYVVVAPDPTATRGKVIRLSSRGATAQQAYQWLVHEIEKRWEYRYGAPAIAGLRTTLESLFVTGKLSEGLLPPPGTARAGDQAPALGRRDVGPAALQRTRDLVAQTESYVRDPAANLPHYPAWDMNRGFGP